MGTLRSSIALALALSVLASGSFAQQSAGPDEDAVKAVVQAFLDRLGAYDLEAVPELFAPNANIGAVSLRSGTWRSATYSLDEFIARVANSESKTPYSEPVQQWTVNVSNGNLAFVLADAQVLREGRLRSHNIDYFVLLRIDGEWKILSAAYTATPIEDAGQ